MYVAPFDKEFMQKLREQVAAPNKYRFNRSDGRVQRPRKPHADRLEKAWWAKRRSVKEEGL